MYTLLRWIYRKGRESAIRDIHIFLKNNQQYSTLHTDEYTRGQQQVINDALSQFRMIDTRQQGE